MARDEYDVYFTPGNQGTKSGYMLAKGSDGNLLSSASRSQAQDPFTQYTSTEERWKRASFTFKDGAGCAKYDGSPRYATGQNIDSRSGKILLGPNIEQDPGGNADWFIASWTTPTMTLGTYHLSSDAADNEGVAMQFGATAEPVRVVQLLVKRREGYGYGTAAAFTVEIWTDDGGGAAAKPNALVAGCQASVSLQQTSNHWIHNENLWIPEEYFWLEVHFPAQVTLGTALYWLCVMNNQANTLELAYDNATVDSHISKWTGAAWANGGADKKPMVRFADHTDVDAFVYAFSDFTGADGIRRMYAAVGPKVMYYTTSGTDGWYNSKIDFAGRVLELLEFNSVLFAAVEDTGAAGNFWWTTGATATTVWAQHATEGAQCFALHDNILWKGESYGVKGSTSGTGVFGTAVNVGDLGTPVSSLISHGGKLYAAKPEGIFELSYPDTYPGTGAPTCNQVLDFRTDKTARPFILDWHSGCYFTGSGGLYEWKDGILTDVWRERFTDDGATSLLPVDDGERMSMVGVCGTTRGIALVQSSAFVTEKPGIVWWYDGRAFHPLLREIPYMAEPMYAVYMESLGYGRARLWWASGTNIYYSDMPTWTDNRAADSDMTFWDESDIGGLSEFYLPEFDDGRPDMLKDWYQLRVRTQNAGAAAGGTLLVYKKIDDAASWSLVGTSGVVDTSPLETLTFGVSTTGYKIKFKVVLVKNNGVDTDNSIAIEAIDLMYQPLPDTITQHQAWIRAAQGIEKHNGAIDQRTAGQIYTLLAGYLEESEPLTYQDVLGETHTVRLMGVTTDSVRQIEGKEGIGTGADLEALVLVSMLEV